MTEAELHESIRDLCRWLRVLIYHTHDSRQSQAGFPDLVIVTPDGVLFRELKSERGRLTADQQTWIDRLQEAGADAAVWRPGDWPERIHAEIEPARWRQRRLRRQATA